MKKRFYKVSILAEVTILFLSVLLVKIAGVGEDLGAGMTSILNKIFSIDTSEAGNATVYVFQIITVFYFAFAMLLSYLCLKVITADATPIDISTDKKLFRQNNFWKFCFYANLYINLTILLLFFIFITLSDTRALFYFNDTFDYWVLLTAGTLLASCITAALLLSTSVLWQDNRIIAVLLTLLAVVFFLTPAITSAACSFVILNNNNSNNGSFAANATTETPIIKDYETDVLPDTSTAASVTGNWAENLWTTTSGDQDSVQAAAAFCLNNVFTLSHCNAPYSLRYYFSPGIKNAENNLDADDYWHNKTAEKQGLFNYNKLVNFIGRDCNKLNSFFESYKSVLYALVNQSAYHSSGAELTITTLLATHDELFAKSNTIEKLDRIYSIMTSNDNAPNATYYYDTLSKIISDNIEYLLTINEHETNTGSDQYDDASGIDKGSVVWAYSFWARRYKEGNDDAVSNILYEIDNYYSDDEEEEK